MGHLHAPDCEALTSTTPLLPHVIPSNLPSTSALPLLLALAPGLVSSPFQRAACVRLTTPLSSSDLPIS